MKAPNEKLTELLFARYMLQSFRLNEVSLYAPSSREEFYRGYDAKFIGNKSCKEIYLQFKTPNVTSKGFTIRITPHQHNRLRLYPYQSAYYVSHTFKDISEIQNCQSRISSSRDFLKRYIAINAYILPCDTNFLQYERYPNKNSEFPREPKYKTKRDGNIRKAGNTIERSEWLRGDSISQKFKDDQIGNQVIFGNIDGSEYRRVRFIHLNKDIADNNEYRQNMSFYLYPDLMEFIEDEEGNFGIMLRMYN